jgi:hypothetical protein
VAAYQPGASHSGQIGMSRFHPQATLRSEGSRGANSENRLLGYARVSSYRQTLDAQLNQLRADGCARLTVRRRAARARTGASFSKCSTPSPPATW